MKRKIVKELQNNGRRLAMALVLVILAASLIYEGWYYGGLHQKEKQYESLKAAAMVEIPEQQIPKEIEDTEQTEEENYCDPVYDFEELRENNADIYAWVTVPGTQTDYPILQNETDNYYLERNLDHSQGYPGCIYTNSCNVKDFSDYNTVLYGHNMKNGTMFGSLHQFEDENFFAENREIYVYTEEQRLTYEVYAAVKFSDVYIPYYYEVTTTEGRDAFLAAVAKAAKESDVSHILAETEVKPEDRFITLSTCVNGEREKRFLVVGRLTEEAYYGKKE